MADSASFVVASRGVRIARASAFARREREKAAIWRNMEREARRAAREHAERAEECEARATDLEREAAREGN